MIYFKVHSVLNYLEIFILSRRVSIICLKTHKFCTSNIIFFLISVKFTFKDFSTGFYINSSLLSYFFTSNLFVLITSSNRFSI